MKKVYVIGVIAYIHAGDGCILGKYQENGLIPRTECLTRKNEEIKNEDQWVGNYDAVWIEGDGRRLGTVKIEKRGVGYLLNWWDEDGTKVFYGHGMIDEKKQLVVCYWNDDLEEDTKIYSTI